MTEEELEQKAEEYVKQKEKTTGSYPYGIKTAYKDGYEQGQKDFDKKVTKLLNSYDIKFIDTDSIGGIIACHQLFLEIEKENKDLRELVEKLRSNIASLSEYSEIDVDEDGELIY